jgi:hypothetical protein
VRYQLLTAWPVSGQHCIEAGTEIDLNQPESAWTQNERWVAGRTPPINCILALDWDAAWVMHESYPDFRHRLRRQLTPLHEEMFQRLVDGRLRVLSRAQVSLAKQLGEAGGAAIARDREEQAKREREAVEFKRELQQQIDERINERRSGNG